MRYVLPIARLAIIIIVAVLVATALHARAAVYDTINVASSSPSTLNLLRGTPGDRIPVIKYEGRYDIGKEWDYCNVTAKPSYGIAGLTPKIISATCTNYFGDVRVEVRVGFEGAFQGGSVSLTPISTLRVDLYFNNTKVETLYLTPQTIYINEVYITVSLGSPPVVSGTVSYSVSPSNPTLGSTIVWYPSATINVKLELSEYLSVDTTVQFKYRQPGYNVERAVTVTFSRYTLSKQIQAPAVDLTRALYYDIVIGNNTVTSGTLDLSPASSYSISGGAMVTVYYPYVTKEGSTYYVVGGVFVNELISGRVEIALTIDGKTQTRTAYSTGAVEIKIPVGDTRPDTVSGVYELQYIGPTATGPTVTIRFNQAQQMTTGTILSNVFYIIASLLSAAGFAGIVFGLFLRRPDLQTSGLLLLTSVVLVFMIPTMFAYVVVLMTKANSPDPIGLSNLNMANLGEKLDEALRYIQEKSFHYSSILRNAAIGLIGVLVTLAGITTGGGVFGLLTGGALSQFLGHVLGSLGGQIVMLASLSFMAAIFLNILAQIFPTLINIIFILMLALILLQALFVAFTGSPAQLFGSIISLSMLILIILLTPSILAMFDQFVAEQSIEIDLKVVSVSIPNPFTKLALVVLEITFLSLILVMAFQRLMAMFTQPQ